MWILTPDFVASMVYAYAIRICLPLLSFLL
jgi:hypothetical protein